MIVCVCNRISDKAAQCVARTTVCRGVSDVYRCLGCRVQCGKCVPEMRRILAGEQSGAAQSEAPTGHDRQSSRAA